MWAKQYPEGNKGYQFRLVALSICAMIHSLGRYSGMAPYHLNPEGTGWNGPAPGQFAIHLVRKLNDLVHSLVRGCCGARCPTFLLRTV